MRVIEYSLMYSKTMSAPCRPTWGRAGPLFSTTIWSGCGATNPDATPLVGLDGSSTAVVMVTDDAAVRRSP